MVIRSRRQNSNGRKPCNRNQQTCKVHGAIEYDDSTLRQRNHAANDMTSSQLASHTIFIFVNVTLVVAGFVLKGQPQNCSGHSRVSSSLKDLQCIAVCKADVSSAIQTSTTHPLSGQVAESPILIRQRTNHAGRLLLLTGAPGCPTGSTTGLLQWDSLQRSLVHGSGRLTTAPLRTNNSDQAKPQDIRRTKEQLLDS